MSKLMGIWIRVSTEDQAKGESPEHHEQRARMYAELKGWTIKEVYHLEAVSGKSVMEHPECKRMLRDIRQGAISGLIFSKLARLARNTRELLDFADIFRECSADLVSLQEAIDTSSPAGRFFYTIIAAMAEWEREEIADRVKASVPIRAHMGKSLGGEAPYGYKWINKMLEIDENEAPVRKLMYELFSQYKRKRKVANVLTEQGYRTRKGEPFSPTTIDRLLRDPIAKGLRRANYTQSLGEGKGWELKPKEDWIFQPAPIIVSEELWDTCNDILNAMTTKKGLTRRPAVHLFSGVTRCSCGTKMYMRSNSPAYFCQSCKNKIKPDDLEHIFHEQLRNFLFTEGEIEKSMEVERKKIQDYEIQITNHQKRIEELKTNIKRILDLFYSGKLEKDAFNEYHDPLYEEKTQREQSVLELQGTIDNLSMQTLSNDQVLHDARNLHAQWHTFTVEEKRTIVEAITESIIIGKEDIEIHLNYIPTFVPDDTPPSTPNPSKPNKKKGFGPPLLSLPFKLLQLCTTGMPVWVLQPPRQGVCMWPWGGTEVPEQDIRPIAGPYRPACRSDPCAHQ